MILAAHIINYIPYNLNNILSIEIFTIVKVSL